MSNSADTGAPTAAAIAAAGITYPPIDELLTRTSSKYGLSIYAAKRARQINDYYAQHHPWPADLRHRCGVRSRHSPSVCVSRPALISRSAIDSGFSLGSGSTSGPTYSSRPSPSWA